MRGTLGHATAPAARTEASPLAGKRNQTIRATAFTTKSRKPTREHAAANESLKLTLDEQRGAPLVIMSLKLAEEGL